MNTAVILTAIFIGALIQGVSGFGFALVSLGILGFFSDIATASIIITLSGFPLTFSIFLRTRAHFVLKPILPCIAGIVAGTPIGVFLLLNADKRTVTVILGMFMICAGIYSCIPRIGNKPWHPVYLGIPCGLAAGILGGAFSTGGPPLVAFAASRDYSKFRYTSVLQACFFTYGILRLPLLVSSGLITGRILLAGLAGSALTVTGGLIGLRILADIPEKTFKKIVMVFIILLGCKYLLFG